MNRRILVVPLIATALAGCGPLGSPGSLQKGAFAYACSTTNSTTDLGCGGGIFQTFDVPASIAVGTHFDLQYGPALSFNSSQNAVVAALTPAAPSLLATEDAMEVSATGFRFAEPGIVAILARAADGRLVDFVHVKGVALDHVALQNEQGQGIAPFAVPTGGAMLKAIPQSLAGQALAGQMSYFWTSSDTTVATVGGTGSSVVVLPVSSGKATITIQILDKQASVDVTVP
jgi:hypothetical protein